jgi:excisionase family DNA binding protein
MEDDELLRAKDVAHILDCSPDDVYPLINTGELKAFKVGRLWRFRLEDVMDCKKRMAGRDDSSPKRYDRARSHT